jgi:hypothetical protein
MQLYFSVEFEDVVVVIRIVISKFQLNSPYRGCIAESSYSRL